MDKTLDNGELITKLTKAKEIIKNLLSLCEGETDSKLVFARAEQFLSEVEKMTEEQIKQRAEKHADAYATPDLEDSFRVYIYEANKDGYIAGATEATKELQEQIEKMKCCGNCKHQCSFLFQDEIDCANNGLPKWEIKEK